MTENTADDHDEEAEGLALYARLREEAREQILASAAVLASLPYDVSRRALITIIGLLGVIVHDTAVVSTGQPTEATITAQAVAACIVAVCAMTGTAT